MNRRFVALGLAFLAVVALRVIDPFPETRESQTVSPVTRRPASVERSEAAASHVAKPGPSNLREDADASRPWPVRLASDVEPMDLFNLPVPPPVIAPQAVVTQAPPPPPPPPPTVPPFPYTVVGAWTEDEATRVFLGTPAGTIMVKAGDTLAGTYRVDEIGKNLIRFTYLPLNQTQQLNWSTPR